MEKAEVLPRGIKWHFIGGLQSSMPFSFPSLPLTFLLSSPPLSLSLWVLDMRSRSRVVSCHIQVGCKVWCFVCSMMSKWWRERASEVLLHVYISELIPWLHSYHRSLCSGYVGSGLCSHQSLLRNKNRVIMLAKFCCMSSGTDRTGG
jgi:hypothetical protein